MNQADESAKAEKSATDAGHHFITLSDVRMRQWVSWGVVVSTGVLAAFFFGFLISQTIRGPVEPTTWLTILLNKHYAAIVGTPLSAVAAYCVVTLLKVTNGPIEFEAIGFKFRGASGPIVLWIFSFLAVGTIFHFLWANAA